MFWLVSLPPTSLQSSLLGVIISNWQTKGLGAYQQVGAAWLASSVDSLSGHPPSLCLPHSPSISRSKEPSPNQTLCPFNSSVVQSFHMSMWAWYMKQDPQDGFFYFSLLPADVLPIPCPPTRFLSALSLPLQNMIWPVIRECISEELEISLYQHASKTFSFGKMPLQPLSSPLTWSDRERPSKLTMRVYAVWGSKTPQKMLFINRGVTGENKSKKKVNLYYVFLLHFS